MSKEDQIKAFIEGAVGEAIGRLVDIGAPMRNDEATRKQVLEMIKGTLPETEPPVTIEALPATEEDIAERKVRINMRMPKWMADELGLEHEEG